MTENCIILHEDTDDAYLAAYMLKYVYHWNPDIDVVGIYSRLPAIVSADKVKVEVREKTHSYCFSVYREYETLLLKEPSDTAHKFRRFATLVTDFGRFTIKGSEELFYYLKTIPRLEELGHMLFTI